MSGIFDDSLVGSGWFVSDIPASGMFDEDMLRAQPAVGGNTNYTLTCEPGVYSLAGNAATLAVTKNYALTCDVGAYSMAGVPAALAYAPGASAVNYSLTCDPGAFALVGQGSTFNYARSLSAASGPYTLSGGAATFTRTISLSCSAGSFVLSGGDAQFTRTIKLEANNVYGSGRHPTRDEVEKHWELVALRDEEEKRQAQKLNEQLPVPVSAPAVESGPVFQPSSLPSSLSIQAPMMVTVAQSNHGTTTIENEVIARARKQREEEALIVLLMEI